ncbi:MAG: NAD(P)-dependent oxidoreductase [Alphaproteobacteria bacterium]|nr:NAD(P)-dependent oxidoreductase [Alphaproteobacteria bacterium]
MSDVVGWKIGLIGLGHMGRPMARNLHKAGATVTVSSRSPGPVDELASEGMAKAATPREVAAASDIIIMMVTDTASVDLVLHGPDGVIAGLNPGATIIDMGTTKVRETRQWAEEVAQTGNTYIDAPVSGGQVGAEQGSLSIMAGGSAEVLERVRPVFDVLGKNITHIGNVGAGQVAKTANQSIVAVTLAAVAEGLTLAQRAGVDPAKVREALQGGFAESRVLDLHGGRMVERMFEAGGPARVQLKDVDQALELAAQVGLEPPTLINIQKLWQKMIDHGWGDLDQAGIIRVIEEL